MIQENDALSRIMEDEHFILGSQSYVGDDEIGEKEGACGDACV